MKELKIEFRLGQAKLRLESHETLGWAMQTSGLLGDVRHDIRSAIGPSYPSRRQQSMFFARSSRQIHDWFDGPEFDEAKKRAEDKRHGGLILIPGRG
jgi:hypothetical protein